MKGNYFRIVYLPALAQLDDAFDKIEKYVKSAKQH
jgi:hypothetical protein